MSYTAPSFTAQTFKALFDPFTKFQRRANYWLALSSFHLDSIALPYAPVLQKRADSYWLSLRANEEWSVDDLAYAIELLIETAPATLEYAFDVDDGGYTKRKATTLFSTEWLPFGSYPDGFYIRFSQARTAAHVSGVLRTPVMGGFSLEITQRVESTDPRDAVTVLVYGKKKEEDARYPWVKPQSSQIFDFTEFADRPYFAGPLYNGHPNEIEEGEKLQSVIAISRDLVLKALYC